MEHIVNRYMLSVPEGSSFFLSPDLRVVFGIIEETHERPDNIFVHRFKKDRKV